MSRQVRRRARFIEELRGVNEEFGFIAKNHELGKRPQIQYHVPRRARRRIARAKAKELKP